MKWTKEELDWLITVLIAVFMVLLIPTLFIWNWLQDPVNWRKVLGFVNWLLNKALELV